MPTDSPPGRNSLRLDGFYPVPPATTHQEYPAESYVRRNLGRVVQIRNEYALLCPGQSGTGFAGHSNMASPQR